MSEAFVCGYPVTHSRSPLIHRFWLDAYDIEGGYHAVDTAPEDLAELLSRVRRGELVGGNVTIPLKEDAYHSVDRRDDAATAIGAVNTLWREGDTLWGGNTDAYGFAANLDAGAPGWAGGTKTALVLGAGGAARAVLHALLERGVETVFLANRTLARAEALAHHFGPKIKPVRWDGYAEALGTASLLVNTTPAGMRGKHDGPSVPVDLSPLPAGAVVTDIVYVPIETPLILAARARKNLRVVDGLGMLLHQAVPGFERWFGKRPEVTDALRALIAADIEGSRA